MKGYIKESQLPACIDIVVWGHEHKCEIGGGMAALASSAEVCVGNKRRFAGWGAAE